LCFAAGSLFERTQGEAFPRVQTRTGCTVQILPMSQPLGRKTTRLPCGSGSVLETIQFAINSVSHLDVFQDFRLFLRSALYGPRRRYPQFSPIARTPNYHLLLDTDWTVSYLSGK
jgi:hypothetical protein